MNFFPLNLTLPVRPVVLIRIVGNGGQLLLFGWTGLSLIIDTLTVLRGLKLFKWSRMNFKDKNSYFSWMNARCASCDTHWQCEQQSCYCCGKNAENSNWGPYAETHAASRVAKCAVVLLPAIKKAFNTGSVGEEWEVDFFTFVLTTGHWLVVAWGKVTGKVFLIKCKKESRFSFIFKNR